MPDSITPERHPERNRRRRTSRSSSCDSSQRNSNKKIEESKHQRSYGSHRKTSNRNNDDGRRRREDRENESRSRRNYRSRSKSRERLDDKRKHERSGTSHGESTSSHRKSYRDSEKSRNDSSRVVIKEEPVSDEEDRRRRRNRRVPEVSVKTEPKQSSFEGPSGQGNKDEEKEEEVKPKEKPNFQVSGKLAEDTNIFNGVVVKYNEPPEAKKPMKRWRLYAFKGDEALPMLQIHRQSAYLLGRERKIADIPVDHPSCSKQHAVLQFRALTYTREDGTSGRRVRPYIIDLDSSNGTFINNTKIDPRRYVELFEKDVIKFGFSSREYVLLHEGSASDDIQDDDLKNEEEAGGGGEEEESQNVEPKVEPEVQE